VSKNHREIVDFLLKAYPDALLVYLFGSRANNSHNEGSDWDVAVLTSCQLDKLLRWERAQELAAVLNQDVDLIDLYSASTVLQKQIIDTGVLLFERGNEAANFDMKVLSMYARLEESRTDLIEHFVGGISNASK